MSHDSEAVAIWEDAWKSAEEMLVGVTRHRVSGSAPGVELALMDWGGDGDLAVLHHANGFCGATLAPIAKALSDRYRVVTIDARGHGDSTSVSPKEGEQAYAWSTLAEDLDVALGEVLDLVGVDRVKLAIGHSFGGALILAAAQKNPARFENILLCDPVIFPPMSIEQRAAHTEKSGLVEATLRRRDCYPTRAEALAHFRSRGLFANFTKEALALYVAEGLRENEAGEFELKCAREVEAAVFGGPGSGDLFSRVEKITAKVLFAHAQFGNFSREVYEEIASRISNAQVKGFDVRHLFPMEEPERVTALVDELMTSES